MASRYLVGCNDAQVRLPMTVRGIAIGTACAVALALTIPYTDLLVRGSWFGLTAFPIGSLLALMAVVAILGPPLKLVRRPLSAQELAIVASMALVSAGIASFGLTALLMPYLVGPTYYMQRENHFLEHLPQWAMVQGEMPVEAFYEGLPDDTRIPWEAWLTPLGAWSLLALGVYTVFFSLTALLRRQWMEHERMVFPLAELPAAMVTEGDGTPRLMPPFFRERTMWLFFLVPFLLHTLNGISHYWPSVPSANIGLISLDAFLTEHPWNRIGPLWVRIPFCVIGIAYFLPLNISRSLWAFYLFFLAQTYIGARAGYEMPLVQAFPTRAFIAHQMWGGILVSGVYIIWSARRHIAAVVRAAVSGETRPELAGEFLSPRMTTIGVLGGFTLICAWGVAAGAGLGWTALLFALYFLTHIVAVRLVCEGGMLYVQHPFRPLNFLLAALGTKGIATPRIPMLALWDHLWMLDNRSPLMPTLMLSQRIAEPSGISRRSLAPALALAVLAAVLASFYSYLRLMYLNGGLLVDPWFSTYYAYNLYGTWTEQLVVSGQQQDARALWTMGAGAMTFAGLLVLNLSFPKWGLHPIGYLMGASWPMINFWFPIMLGWAIKSTVMRVGGVRLLRQLGPGFLGLILAEFLCAAFWAIVGAVTQTEGYKVFAI